MSDRGTDGSGGGPAGGDGARGIVRLRPDLVWPVGITLALLVVVAVNVAFIVVAVRGQDQVVSSYVDGER